MLDSVLHAGGLERHFSLREEKGGERPRHSLYLQERING